nr:stAR-related lipid transfer protein 6 [Biomphalaria glabrata]
MSYEQDFTKLKERAITLADDKNGWSVSSKSKNDVLIESRPSDLYSATIYRVTAKVKASVQVVKETIAVFPGSKRLEWDSNLKEISEMKRITEKQWIQVSRSNGIGKGLISPREFVDLTELEQTEDYCLLTGGSIEYPEMKSNDKYVRGWNGIVALRIEKDSEEPEFVHLVYVSEIDFKGKIPRSLVDATMASVLAGTVTNWFKFMEQCGYLKS